LISWDHHGIDKTNYLQYDAGHFTPKHMVFAQHQSRKKKQLQQFQNDDPARSKLLVMFDLETNGFFNGINFPITQKG